MKHHSQGRRATRVRRNGGFRRQLAHLIREASKRHVKIFLDGAEEPAVDLPFSQYFDGIVRLSLDGRKMVYRAITQGPQSLYGFGLSSSAALVFALPR
jgi:hypothetical protein